MYKDFNMNRTSPATLYISISKTTCAVSLGSINQIMCSTTEDFDVKVDLMRRVESQEACQGSLIGVI